MGFPLFMILCLSLASFGILSLTFAMLIMICIRVGLFGFMLSGTFFDFHICFLLQAWEVSSHNFVRYIFNPFLSSASGTPKMQMLDVVSEVP